MSKEDQVLKLSRELTGQWTVPILLSLDAKGGRFTPLQNKLDIAPSRLSSNLKKMVTDGLLIHLSPQERRHPLLPEYVLTEKGLLHREAARAVQISEEQIGHGRLSDKSWGMPILLTINYDHGRFQEIRHSLEGITPRILSLRLQQFYDDRLIFKRILEEPRPSFLYQLESEIHAPIEQLSLDLASIV